MKRYCLTLDLINDEQLIAEYEAYHRSVWPEIEQSILDSGISHMEIYRVSNRLFMIMEVDDNFSFERKQKSDSENPKVQQWESMMLQYQQLLPFAKHGEKWVLMDKIYELKK